MHDTLLCLELFREGRRVIGRREHPLLFSKLSLNFCQVNDYILNWSCKFSLLCWPSQGSSIAPRANPNPPQQVPTSPGRRSTRQRSLSLSPQERTLSTTGSNDSSGKMMHCPELFLCEESSKGRDLMSFSQGKAGVEQQGSPSGV